MKENSCDSGYKIIVVVLLALCTYFLGSIWIAMGGDCHMGKSKYCPFKDRGSKMCPVSKMMMDGAKTAVK